MGQAVTLALGVVGAVAGGVLTGGAGWAIEAGLLAGELLGNILFPQKGPNPPNVRVQDSAYGKYIPMVWGRYRLSGNVIWMGTPHSFDSSSSGKGGGGKGSNQPYTTLSFAVALCQGPIQGLTRIWANGQLIYDISNPSDWQSLSGSSQMVTNFSVYYGTETQLPDPTLASYQGAATPSYRGLAYVVFNELNLQRWGNYMPSLTFEVQGAGSAATSTKTTTVTMPAGPQTQNTGIITSATGGSFKGWAWTNLSSLDAVPFTMTPYGIVWGTTRPSGGFGWLPGGEAFFGLFNDADGEGRCIINTGSGFQLMHPDPNNVQNGLPVPGWGGVGDEFANVLIQNGWVFVRHTENQNNLYSQQLGVGGANFINPTGNLVSYMWGCDGTNLYGTDTAGNFCVWTAATGALVANHGAPPFTPSGGGYLVSATQIFATSATGYWEWNGSAWSQTGLPGNFGEGPNQPTSAFGAGAPGASTTGSIMASAVLASNTTGGIISEVCQMAGLSPSQFDVSQCTDTVVGYASTDNSAPADIIKPLMQAYFIDASDSDGMLKFPVRGATPAVTIPWDDLGADAREDSSQAQNPIQESIAQEVEFPRTETINYISSSTDYQTLTQRWFNDNTASNLDETISFPGVMADNEAKVRVIAVGWERWSKRRSFKFSTGYKWLQLEPGDVADLQRQDLSVVPVRITKVEADGKGVYSFDADFTVPSVYPRQSTQSMYTAQSGAAAGFVKTVVPYSGPTILAPLDIPPLQVSDATKPGMYMAATGLATNWPGCIVDMSRDDVNFAEQFAALSGATIGYVNNVLGNYQGGNIPDEANTLNISLYGDNAGLSSVNYTSFINGANAAYVGGELIYFRNATQTGTNTWVLSGLLRGRLSTEFAIPTHQTGDIFVLLSSANLHAVPLSLTDVGQNVWFEAFLNNQLGNKPSVDTTPVNVVMARLQPMKPHLLTASNLTSGITLQWFRKARINYVWADSTDVPLDWTQESYTISVYNSAGIQVNQYTLTSKGITWSGGASAQTTPVNPAGQALPLFTGTQQPTFVYTPSMIANDGFSSGQSITIKVQQIGDYGVAGQAASLTLTALAYIIAPGSATVIDGGSASS